MNDVESTVKLAEEFQAIGISAIAVHGRKIHERPQHANDAGGIRAVSERLTIPVISNGGSRDIEKYEDILKFKNSCGSSSVMIARAAEWNVSIFRKEGIHVKIECVENVLKMCLFSKTEGNEIF